MPVSSRVELFIKILPMVLLALPAVMVGVLVTLALPKKTVFAENGPKPGDPGNLFVIESMSMALVLPNNGVRLKSALFG